MTANPRIIVTAGDPAGVGPDIVLAAAADGVVAVGDAGVLKKRAAMLGSPVSVVDGDARGSPLALPVIHEACAATVTAGELNPANGAHTINCINRAVDLCAAGEFDAMVTAPVSKAVINDAGVAFVGNTEWIAARVGAPTPVMMLVGGDMRVALLTTHLPLIDVPRAVTGERIKKVVAVIVADLHRRFGIDAPSIGVCGLNPHAGEGGWLGREEIDIIAPALDALHDDGVGVVGPLPADTVFTKKFDAILAMYHDQGLPAVKHAHFFDAVNVTLGLPIVRASPDHGTAADLAGSGRADARSLIAAVKLAGELATPIA